MSISSFLRSNRHILPYGASLASLLFLLNWLKMRLVFIDHALEIYIGSVAVIFTALGIWLALKLTHPKIKTIVVEKEVLMNKPVSFSIDEKEIARLNLTRRELEVLQLMSKGLSNQEIAEQLFLSLSTVKTHSNNLFDKMSVKRRTQAVEKARRLGIIV